MDQDTPRKKVQVQIPGKVMLAGEYAVLWGGQSLAFTLDKKMHLTAEIPQGGGIVLSSDHWVDPLRTPWPLQEKTARWSSSHPPPLFLRAVYAALQEYSLPGLDLKVRSAIRTRDGFGSSSALCLGTMLAASFLAPRAGQNDIPAPLRALLPAAKKAYELQKQAQGFASGYDIATQLVGGLVLFSQREDAPWPFMLERLPHETAARIPGLISLYTGGRGAPTTTVGGKTAPWLRERFGIAAVVEASADLVKGFLDLLGNEPAQRSADIWAQFFVALQAHRQLFIDAPAYPRGLFSALSSLPGFDRRWSAKPSGAGGEDALLLMGKSPDDLLQADALLQQHGWSRCAYSLADQGAALVGHDEKQEALQ